MTFSVEKNDILLLYSDCLFESRTVQGEAFGISRIAAILESVSINESAQFILDYLMDEFIRLTGDSGLQDDLTVILMKKCS